MPKYLDLSANVSISMEEVLGAKPAPEAPAEQEKAVEE